MNKIAIIEDDIDICNMIAKFLEKNKYIVHYALNGRGNRIIIKRWKIEFYNM